MKNSLLIPFIVFCSFHTQAQTEKKGLQKITFGAVFAASGTMNLKEIKPFVLGYNLSPNVCVVTTKTYHNFLYGLGNNTAKAINAYKPRPDLGLYTALSKSFSSKSAYAGVGIEKFVKADAVTFFLFTELGTNMNPSSNVFTIGIHANIQTPIWKRK